MGRQKTVPEEEKVRVQAEMATAQAAAEEARLDLARTLAAVRSRQQTRDEHWRLRCSAEPHPNLSCPLEP